MTTDARDRRFVAQWVEYVSTGHDVTWEPQEGDLIYVEDTNMRFVFIDGVWHTVNASGPTPPPEESDLLPPDDPNAVLDSALMTRTRQALKKLP
jgi:hypothetical protein